MILCNQVTIINEPLHEFDDAEECRTFLSLRFNIFLTPSQVSTVQRSFVDISNTCRLLRDAPYLYFFKTHYYLSLLKAFRRH